MQKTITCRNCQSTHTAFEEKESDVRIATRMIADVVLDKCDITILVSADSDLIPPIEFIREIKPKHKIFVYLPPRRTSNDLKNKSNSYVVLDRHEDKFASSIMPLEMEDKATGYLIKKANPMGIKFISSLDANNLQKVVLAHFS